MRMRMEGTCADINTRFCPCLLAETNHCVLCSHLKGGGVCDCQWSGVCILYEKFWRDKEGGRCGAGSVLRKEILSPVLRREKVALTAWRMELSVGAELAGQLRRTGSFVFLRREEDPQFFSFPVGIMKTGEASVEVVIDAVGPKSVRILQEPEVPLVVRGPYFNGVFGQPWIDNISCGKIVILAGGLGQPPALSMIARLVENGCRVSAILAPGRLGAVFIEDELRRMGDQVSVYVVDSLRKNGLPLLRGWLMERQDPPELIVSAGPDEQHHSIISAMQAAGVDLPMAATNNAAMCCGEGICGSCDRVTLDGKVIRTCKIQTDFRQLLS